MTEITKPMEFPEDHAVLCPECFKRPTSAKVQITEAVEYVDPELPITFKGPDHVTGITLSCGHTFGHYMYFIHEPQNVKPERVVVWNFR